jgi:2-amino-4-hydroxy-6-hydroxymethyldihydropteridine diphosphokinase
MGRCAQSPAAQCPFVVGILRPNAIFHWPRGFQKLDTIPMRKPVYLSLGSNIGDRALHLLEAIQHLKKLGTVLAVSSFYETEPVEFTEQRWFLNCVVLLETEKMPRQLLKAVLDLERNMGRTRRQHKGPRTIDIDILLFGNSVLETSGLTIPHPALHQRRFVLEPLAEIAIEKRHPVFNKTIRELRDALPPGQAVRKIPSKSATKRSRKSD